MYLVITKCSGHVKTNNEFVVENSTGKRDEAKTKKSTVKNILVL